MFVRVLLPLAALCLLSAVPVRAADADPPLTPSMRAQLDARPTTPRAPMAPMHATPCVGGFAGPYPCSNIDLEAFVPVSQAGASTTNSLWGWTDPQTNKEYALVGLNNGTAFYDLSTPDHPVYLGKLPTHSGSSLWRDVREFQNYAFVVSDNNGAHGMQVFDLTRLRGVSTPQTWTEDAFYNDTNSAGRPLVRNVHTIAINKDTGFAYLPGSNTCPAPSAGALHMVNITNPLAPTFAGCVTTGGYTHETQCWVYHGPDTAHVGREICANANGPSDRLAIVDVTNKAAPVTLSSLQYAGAGYPHQAWFTEDHRYLLLNDELDETTFGHTARTLVFDVVDLDAPVLVGHHDHGLDVIDHNLYVHGQYVFESNYESGVRILRLGNLSQAQMTEVAFFDTYPQSNEAEFNGTWNNYRFPGSGNVIATGIDEGLFVLKPNLCTLPPSPTGVAATANGANRIDLSWTSGGAGARYRVERAQGGCDGTFATVADDLAASSFNDTTVSGSVTYGYRVVRNDVGESCSSVASTCVTAQTTGVCNAPPVFDGIVSATSAGSTRCALHFEWNAAMPACGGPANYDVLWLNPPSPTPSPAIVASGIAATSFTHVGVPPAPYEVTVRARDATNSVVDANTITRVVIPTGPIGDGTFVSGAEPGQPVLDSGAPTALRPLSPDHAGWHTTSERLHGGTRAFWSTVANNLCVSLVTPPLPLTAGQASSLTYWQAFDMQNGFDGGVLELSTDGGSTWQPLAPTGGYNGTITTGTDCGMSPGRAAFTGSNLTWTQKTVDLSSLAGQTVQVRWLYRSDASVNGEGWYVDDIALTHAQVPGTCTQAGEDALFLHGFED